MAAKKPTTLTSTINESDLEYHELLGSGASGEVYRVTWKSKKLGNVDAAAKKIPLIKDNGEQIEHEISFLQRLKHPNLIEYYGHVVTDTHVVIVLEYAAKGTLYDYLEDKSCLPTDLKRKWAIQAARGIKYLTESSVVHRDIKSPNLLITAENTLKICDFGISKDLESTKTTKSEKGSIQWQAPEIFTESKLSLKADIFALGIVLWELETCEKPYKGKTVHQIMYAVGNHDLRPKIPANVSLILKDLMQQCWHKDRNERPDFDDVISQLESMDLCTPSCGVSATKRDQTKREYRLVFVGIANSGKSSTANTVIGENYFHVNIDGSSPTLRCQYARANVWGRDVVAIDTPGLYDTSQTNDDTKREILKYGYLSAPGPHAIFVVIQGGDLQTEHIQKSAEVIMDTFGEQACKYMVVVVTHNDDLVRHKQSLHEYVNTFPPMMKEILSKCKNRYLVFNNKASKSDARAQIEELFAMVDEFSESDRCFFIPDVYKQENLDIKMVRAVGDVLGTTVDFAVERCIPTYGFIKDQIKKNIQT